MYITTIDLVFFYTSKRYSSINIIPKINIIEISCIIFTFVLIEIVENNAIYEIRRNEFVYLYFKQTILNLVNFI